MVELAGALREVESPAATFSALSRREAAERLVPQPCRAGGSAPDPGRPFGAPVDPGAALQLDRDVNHHAVESAFAVRVRLDEYLGQQIDDVWREAAGIGEAVDVDGAVKDRNARRVLKAELAGEPGRRMRPVDVRHWRA